MGTNNLFLNLAPINSDPTASSSFSHAGPSSAMVLKKVTSSRGSFAVRRVPAAAAALKFKSISANKGVSGVLRLSKSTTVKFGSISSGKTQPAGTQGPVVSILKKNASNSTSTDNRKLKGLSAAFKSTISGTDDGSLTKQGENKNNNNQKILRNIVNKEANNYDNAIKNNSEATSNNNKSRHFSTSSSSTRQGPTEQQQQSTNKNSSRFAININSNNEVTRPQPGGNNNNEISRPQVGTNSNGFSNVSRRSTAGGGGHIASLFTGNPTIPILEASDVTPITEPVFSDHHFSTLDISPILVTHCGKLGYKSLTVVQQRGIPPILQGRDVLIRSQTGSGKTLTYALPIINSLLMMSPSVERSHGVLALIVVPTRELALQTFNWIQDLCKACVKIVPGYLMGGENKSSEKKRLRRGVNILVSTPGRLMDHIDTTECMALRNVRFLVLDEADRMLEMGYERSMTSIIEAITEAKKFGDQKRFESRINKEGSGGQFRSAAPGEGGFKRQMTSSDSEDSPAGKKLKSADGRAISTTQQSEDSDSEDEVANADIDDEEAAEALESAANKQPVISLQSRNTKVVPSNIAAAPRHQTVLLSATLTQQVQRLAGVSLDNPEIVSVSGETESSDMLDSETFVTPENLVQHYTIVPAKLRLVTLASFILGKCLYGSNRKMLVFMATQDMVDYHTSLLQRVLARYGQVEKKVEVKSALETEADRVLDDINAKSAKKKKKSKHEGENSGPQQQIEPLIQFMQLRGNMAQPDRTEVFNKFREAKSGVLLCTDVASRGLDLPSVAWIVQYTAAGSVTDYVHRVGRTSRVDARGDSLLMLAPSEAGYIQQLHKHKITPSEIKANNILTAFTLRPPLMDPMFHLPRSMEEGATNFQMQCEQLLLSNSGLMDQAKKAYISFVRAYASYPVAVRSIFSFKELHLGHYAKSYALREAPSALGASVAYKTQAVIRIKKERKERREKIKLTGVIAQRGGAVPKMATMSEFDSGLDGLAEQLTKQKKDQSKRHNHIATNNRGDRNQFKSKAKKSKPVTKRTKVISSKVKKSKKLK